MGRDSPGSAGSVRCSFCGKPENEVARMVLGPEIRICDECADLLKRVPWHRTSLLAVAAHAGVDTTGYAIFFSRCQRYDWSHLGGEGLSGSLTVSSIVGGSTLGREMTRRFRR